MSSRHLVMLLLLLSAVLSAAFSFKPLSLGDRRSTIISSITNLFAVATTENFVPSSTVDNLPETVLLYDPPAERTWSGLAMFESTPLPTITIVYNPRSTPTDITSAAICEQVPPPSLSPRSTKETTCAVIVIVIILFALWRCCCFRRKEKESKGTQTPRCVTDDNHQNARHNNRKGSPLNNLPNGRHGTNVRNLNSNNIPKITKNITVICNHEDLLNRLADFEREKREEKHARRCLAKYGEELVAEDLSKDALLRIVLDERAKHAQEVNLLQGDAAGLRRRLEVADTRPTSPQKDGESQEIANLKEQIKEIQVEHTRKMTDHTSELNGCRKEIQDLGGELSRFRGANSTQEANTAHNQQHVIELQQEVTQIIMALLWINRYSGYQLVPELKKLLPNLPLDQFATAPINNDAQFPRFRWVLHNSLPDYTFNCPCSGSSGSLQDNLRDQLSSIHPGPSNVLPNYGPSYGVNAGHNTPQPVYGSTGYTMPISQPQNYTWDGTSQGISPALQNAAAGLSQALSSPTEQTLGASTAHLPTPSRPLFPPLNPLPQPTTSTQSTFPPITGLENSSSKTVFPAITGLDNLSTDSDKTAPQSLQWTQPDNKPRDLNPSISSAPKPASPWANPTFGGSAPAGKKRLRDASPLSDERTGTKPSFPPITGLAADPDDSFTSFKGAALVPEPVCFPAGGTAGLGKRTFPQQSAEKAANSGFTVGGYLTPEQIEMMKR
ncbi:hypothetical protein FKW77_010858 [Venturia effusa]|uniref:Uncharacterized protein n=1 Tax=Venturia effusa TaxID=50376 RepID=A0A517KYQ0_9PEZI|nr:hypothetical protein FKW77_010858 [Venturia effusa]